MATEAPVLVTRPNNGERMSPQEFINSTLEVPRGAQLIIKQLTPHWFRVKYYRKVDRPNSFIQDDKIDKEVVYEVVETVNGYELCDRTINNR